MGYPSSGCPKHIFGCLFFNLELFVNNIYPIIIGEYFYKIDAYGMLINAIIAPVIFLSYVALLLAKRKEALKWWRILLTVLPIIYILATITDVIRFNLTLKDILNPNRPVIYPLQK